MRAYLDVSVLGGELLKKRDDQLLQVLSAAQPDEVAHHLCRHTV
jgi:hypothetical protein